MRLAKQRPSYRTTTAQMSPQLRLSLPDNLTVHGPQHSVKHILKMQRQFGNRHVMRWLSGKQDEAEHVHGPQVAHCTLMRQEEETAETEAVDEETRAARAEWDAHPGIHRHFHGGTNDAKFQDYLTLRPLYQGKGIANPAEYISSHIVTVTFFGRSTPAHRDMVEPLKRAEDQLKADGFTPALQSFFAFVPRKMASGNLSNHALGKAVDIDAAKNPHITNEHDFRVIHAVTGVRLNQTLTAEVMRQASEDFKARFNEAWVTEQTATLEALKEEKKSATADTLRDLNKKVNEQQVLVASIKRRRSILNRYAERGFLNLEQRLIDALIAAGFKWGGAWKTQKDFMHFEL